MDCVRGLMFSLSQTHFIREQFFKNWLCLEEAAGWGSLSGPGVRCLCCWSRWADLEAPESWLSSRFPFGLLCFPPVQEHYWFGVNREHSQASITIIRSECLPRICTVEVTPWQGHNKCWPFLLLSLFLSFVWIPAGTQRLRTAESSQNCVISMYLPRNP